MREAGEREKLKRRNERRFEEKVCWCDMLSSVLREQSKVSRMVIKVDFAKRLDDEDVSS